ncbi:protein lurp-one-related 15 [Quercus suber]|uniref:Protein lurp-one-related 15 n=1 Tax=Quercus suber TaxID=58331 RepID=A0AAW0L1Y0_QUESU
MAHQPIPAPTPAGTQFTSPIPIIGPQYCASYPVDLAIVKKVLTITDGNFVVTDINGNVIFKVKGTLLTLHDRRTLLDAAGNPIIMSAHDRWQIFRGGSVEAKDLIFSVKRSSMIQFKTKLHVFLANNTKEDVCDYRIEGSWIMAQTQPNATQFAYPPMPQPQPSGTQFVQTQAVIGPQYCAPYPVDLLVVRKVFTITDGNFAVTDTGGNVIFKVKGVLFSIKTRRLILDATGTPIMTLKPKLLTAHDRWLAFRGDSLNASNLIFTAKRSSFLQFKVKLHVFLANNTQEDVCDYKVEGSWNEKSCTVYHGQSSNIVAQMHKKQTVQSIVMGQDNFSVTIYPNIDYAFIVALIVILDEINQESKEE